MDSDISLSSAVKVKIFQSIDYGLVYGALRSAKFLGQLQLMNPACRQEGRV